MKNNKPKSDKLSVKQVLVNAFKKIDWQFVCVLLVAALIYFGIAAIIGKNYTYLINGLLTISFAIILSFTDAIYDEFKERNNP
ncbi:MAG: hypothetical protein HXX16_17235 [Bacteroidales bacterium]|nr:hypothetical protein [Bacteroidales bacterium]